jgi:hypothetical protein
MRGEQTSTRSRASTMECPLKYVFVVSVSGIFFSQPF